MSEETLSIPGNPGYVLSCIREVENAYYGRQVRRPIHDAIIGIANTAHLINAWVEGIGLVVQNGKLCIVYGTPTTNPSGSQSIVIPTNIQTALNNILTQIAGDNVRQAIVTALGWAYTGSVTFEDLGLTVKNGLLCYTTESIIPESSISVGSALTDITSANYGRDTRAAIVKALRLGADRFEAIIQTINDIGLTVLDGKLCAVFEESGLLPNE